MVGTGRRKVRAHLMREEEGPGARPFESWGGRVLSPGASRRKRRVVILMKGEGERRGSSVASGGRGQGTGGEPKPRKGNSEPRERVDELWQRGCRGGTHINPILKLEKRRSSQGCGRKEWGGGARLTSHKREEGNRVSVGGL